MVAYVTIVDLERKEYVKSANLKAIYMSSQTNIFYHLVRLTTIVAKSKHLIIPDIKRTSQEELDRFMIEYEDACNRPPPPISICSPILVTPSNIVTSQMLPIRRADYPTLDRVTDRAIQEFVSS